MLRTNLSFLSFIETLYANRQSGSQVTLEVFAKDSPILRRGDVCRQVFIVKSGITKCFFSEENGKDYIVEFLAEGEIIGEIEAIKGTTCLCNIEAITEVQAYSLRIAFFKKLVSQDPAFNQMLLEELAERIINTSSRSSAQQLYTLEQGLKKLLAFQARQQTVISKENMASYLGITVRSLNRALKNIPE